MIPGATAELLDVVSAALRIGLGLAVFFVGLGVMRRGISQGAGDRVRQVLLRVTGHTPSALAAGVALALLFQSTSLVAVVLMEFLDAGLVTFDGAVAVILGSNVGASLTVQFLALRLYEFWLPLCALGLLVAWLGRGPRVRSAGVALTGFGLLYAGIHLVTAASVPLAQAGFLRAGLLALSHSVAGSGLFGLVLTALVQSNGIANSILLSLARQGLLSLGQAIAVIVGANLGSGTLALVAALPSGAQARRLSVANALVNVAGLVWVVPGGALMVRLLDAVSPTVPQALANAHILFNVLASLTVLPLIPTFSRMCALLADHLFPGTAEPRTLPWSGRRTGPSPSHPSPDRR